MSKETEVAVEWHPSGNLTLTVQSPGQSLPRDVIPPTSDRGDFYKKTAKYLAKLAGDGVSFTYVDHPEHA